MDVLLTAGQVITGPAGERISDGAVLIRDQRIAAVGPAADLRGAPGAAELDFPEATVLPGLIDCHVHLAFDAGPDPAAALVEADDAALVLSMAARARQLLDSGVTTVRDLGDRRGLAVRLRDAIAAGVVPGPRILAATSPLTSPGGHCWFLGGEVADERAIRDHIRTNAQAGADVIKVMATGGLLTPGGPAMWQSQFSADALRAIVHEAGLVGLPVAAHAHGTAGTRDAVAAGVRTIEHCTWMAEDGYDRSEDVTADIVAKGICVCPAISETWRHYPERFGPEVTEQLLGRVRWMAERGVRLIAGTDSGIPGAHFDAYVEGLHVFRHAGLPPERVLEIATVESARALGLADVTGRLAPGLRADLVVVDGDPLADLDALRAVRLVVAEGRPHVASVVGLAAGGPPATSPATAR